MERKTKGMDAITTEMAEYICDCKCYQPKRTDIDQEQLDDICCECKLGKFVCDILNEHNGINGPKEEKSTDEDIPGQMNVSDCGLI